MSVRIKFIKLFIFNFLNMGERNFIPEEESRATNLNVSELSSGALEAFAEAHDINRAKKVKLPGVKREDDFSKNLKKPEEIDWGGDQDKLAA